MGPLVLELFQRESLELAAFLPLQPLALVSLLPVLLPELPYPEYLLEELPEPERELEA